jgi:hypothetical protein
MFDALKIETSLKSSVDVYVRFPSCARATAGTDAAATNAAMAARRASFIVSLVRLLKGVRVPIVEHIFYSMQ